MLSRGHRPPHPVSAVLDCPPARRSDRGKSDRAGLTQGSTATHGRDPQGAQSFVGGAISAADTSADGNSHDRACCEHDQRAHDTRCDQHLLNHMRSLRPGRWGGQMSPMYVRFASGVRPTGRIHSSALQSTSYWALCSGSGICGGKTQVASRADRGDECDLTGRGAPSSVLVLGCASG
jgi:hypothetical protein